MVLYFSGTGNSRYIAKRIAEKLGDTLFDINAAIKESAATAIETTDGRLVFVVPTYAWRIPLVVRDWIEHAEFAGNNKKTWFVMDCGGEIGNAAKYNIELCGDKAFEYMGTAQIVMPENYIAMFSVPVREKAAEIISRAEPAIDRCISCIENGERFPIPRNNLYDRFMSGPVNGLFYSLFVKADAFTAGEKCEGCGKCVTICPLNNIALVDGRPRWDKNCTHCMACIAYCPTNAIEYGKKSVGKPRYTCEKTLNGGK